MKAAFLLSPKKIAINQTDASRPGADEISIQPIRAGICGSDVSLFLGHRAPPAYPLLLGHELVGRVTAVGEGVTQFAVGQRVIVEPNYSCGTCTFCRTGRSNICPNKKSIGVNIPGCFAESFVAPAEFTYPVPDGISDDDAATVEPLAVSLHALWQSGAQLGDTVAVLGCGATGLLLIQAAVAQGIRVIAHDKFADKLEMAYKLGAVIEDRPDRFPETCQVSNVTTVFECAGVTPTVELALSAAPRGSQIVLVGLANSPASFVPLRLVREGLRVSGSIIYNHPSDFTRAIALVANGTLKPSRIVTDMLPFAEISRALEMASSGQSGKVLLKM
ncbi:MAG: alcohol dehydrogenase catalytic domain-containing protein [Chloroflexi bacterium]|nr:alcohol dehydrogenase catalytic domain-containing protein [Chloroflexota bacterium]